MPKCLLLTGPGGFIGSHTITHFLINTDWEIIGLDSFRHKGLTDRITDDHHFQENRNRIKIFTHDLIAPLSPLLIDQIGQVDYIINMASESHVDRSIDFPAPFIQNNINVVTNMLEYARIIKPEVFIQISTDEVYGPMLNKYPHPEWDTILPSNPYSASKAAQEAIAIAYWRTYGVPVVITNTMNNFGERQDPEKYVPKVIRAVLKGDTVTVHGKFGDIGSRFWLHARNHADAILFILQNNKKLLQKFPIFDRPQRFNVVGDIEVDNLQIAETIAQILKKPLHYILEDFHSTRPGHDPHYGLTGYKMREAGWAAPVSFVESFVRTVKWFEANPLWLNL
jgi:dTDP-glucose 4,6-dehydratase